uniref:histone H3.v1-like n=1 Tax=Erigeron canadensis TaxID=72917 RepID=UPI001CB8A2C7|nr:histone H3.v1-like [Erigeron canadensis]
MMKLKGRTIDPNAPLDYVKLQIFPSKNRYETFVCSRNKTEKVASGTLKQLLLHSPRVKDLSSKGLNINFKILPPGNVKDAGWFTVATLTRFLRIIGSPDIFSIGNEIAQLEETRKFQISLSMNAGIDITSSVDSKNELLRAVDLRLTALKDELVSAFDKVTGQICSTKDILDLENFAHHVGAKDIRDSFQKFVEMALFPTVQDLRNDAFNKTERNAPAPHLSLSDPSITYCVSPTQAAQLEQSSTDNHSCISSEEDQPSIERSRTRIRSATPRRSASPMRRIQIGRSGSHRATALTIKSLNYFPAREKVLFPRDLDGNSSDEEEEDPEKPAKKNVLRMSVRDKISLFESKQRDQTVDVLKTKKLLNGIAGSKKAVLRRWSSGMGDNVTQNPNTTTETSPIIPKNEPAEAESDIFIYESQVSAELENIKPDSPETETAEENCEKHPSSIEWNQQKESELDDLFIQMMENKNKPVRHRNPTSDITKSKISLVPREERAEIVDDYKQMGGEKRRGKAPQLKVTHQIFNEKKFEINSNNVNKLQKEKVRKNSTPLMSSRKEASKPSLMKKIPSSLSATRKSCPSTPSPRPTGASPTRTTPPSKNPQSASSTDLLTTKSEITQSRFKTTKSTPPDTNRKLKTDNEKKQATVTKAKKPTKPNLQIPEAKLRLYNEVTKKSGVVALETKPFLRKGSGIRSGASPGINKTKVVDQPEETSRSAGTLIQAEENEVAMTTEIEVNQKECEPQVVSPTKCEESMSPNQSSVTVEDVLKKVPSPDIKNDDEVELMISPNAWVEVEDDHQEEIIPCMECESPVKIVSPVKVVEPCGPSSPQVRHSLSQMLSVESSEEASIGEWGNAEHPPALVYQKDSPKGFKRLLKFARKTKPKSHTASWSSPSALSEGDDESEESKGQSNVGRFTSHNHPKVSEGLVSASMSTTKATKSFFSIPVFRGSKLP